MIKKKFKNKFLYILLIPLLLALLSCNLSGLAGDGIDAAEDSGFDLGILNYSDEEYKSCSFYLGYIDINDNFIITDSIGYTDIIIYKKGDGPNYNKENGYSKTYPSHQTSMGLNKYGMWEPNQETEKAYFDDKEIKGKVSFQNSTLTTGFSGSGLNGRITFRILENGEISW